MVILELSELPKTKIPATTYQDKFHPNHPYFFTGDSKNNNKTACEVILKKNIRKTRSKETSIFSAEARTIHRPLDIISENNHKNLIIFSDTLYVLLSFLKKLQDSLINKTTESTRLHIKL